KLKLEKWVETFVYKVKSVESAEKKMTMNDRFVYAKKYMDDIVKSVWPYIVVGVAIGAIIHGYAPNDLLARYAGPDNFFAVPIATLVGIPLYSNAAGTIPLVSVLIAKGMATGTALAFMMAVTA
ncbi:MAG: permease, partial [Candidatus Saccharibacteria bacterium]